MTKEEILAKGRADNKDNDPIEIAVSRRSIMFGTFVGIILCMALFFINWLTTKQVDFGLWALVFASSGAEMIFRGKKLSQKKPLIGGIVCVSLASIACLVYVILLIAGVQ